MPGAADFQLPNNNAVRSPRSTAVGNRRVPDINHKLVAITAPSTITNCMPAMVEGVDASGYCMVTSSMPMAPMTHMTSMTSSPGMGMGMGHGGMEMGPGVVYWSPMINVPFVNTMGHVNYSCPASQDPSGKDLPSDMNTLRYFFNLGIEVHRMNSGMQPPLNSYGSSSPLPQLMSNGPPSSPMLMTSMEQGQCFTSPDPPRHPATANSTQRTPPTPKQHTPTKHGAHDKSGGQEGGGKGETMDLASDLSDSGCASCGEAGNTGEDDPDHQMELASERTDEDAGSTQGEDGGEKGGRAKGRRKYYTYGPHKLIKPIKDIPPRFQLMLAENSAAKARCEGQPIYMQLSPTDMAVFEQDDGSSALNADAQCFYPTQQYDTVMVDENGLCTYSSSAMAFTASGAPSAPMLMPPPPVMQPGNGGATVGMVYTTAAAPPSTHVMAQPVYTRPLPVSSTQTTRLGDANVMSVANSTNNPACKGPANCASHLSPAQFAHCAGDKWQEEYARPSAASTRLHCKGPDSAPHASVASLPVSVALSQAPPFPSSSSMLPPPSAPSLRAGATPNSACPGGGKQCFYVYPSPSAGYSSAPPQGQSMSQGQVVYFMNPQGYPGPPCTAYQPVMAPPTHLPCPPVAVQ